MALERWLAIASVGLFAMFAGEMYSIYNFMLDVPEDFEFAQAFAADPRDIHHRVRSARACHKQSGSADGPGDMKRSLHYQQIQYHFR